MSSYPNRTRVSSRTARVGVGAMAVAAMVVAMLAPVAAALESSDTLVTDTGSTTETTSDTLEGTTDDPSPSPSPTVEDITGTVEDTTETLEDTTETLDDTSGDTAATLDSTIEEASETLFGSEEPTEDPTAEPSQDPDGDQQQNTTSDPPPGATHDFDDPGRAETSGGSEGERAMSEQGTDQRELDPAAMRAAEDLFDTPRGQRLLLVIPEGSNGVDADPSPQPRVPLEMRANPLVVDHVRLSAGERSTVGIFRRLARLGVEPAVMVDVMVPFPVMGPASYSDDWLAARSTPTPHRHMGTDIFAMRGTPVVAVADGTVTRVADTAVGGKVVYLTAADGTYYYYAHLDGFALGLHAGQRVTAGTLLGFVGNTGNAIGTPPHLHFEVHPRGGEAVPPLPQLDAWLDAARQRLASLEAARAAGSGADGVVPTPLVAPPLQETAEATARSLETLWGSESGLSTAATADGAGRFDTDLIAREVDAAGAIWLVVLTVAGAFLLIRTRQRDQTVVAAGARSPRRADASEGDVELPLEVLLGGGSVEPLVGFDDHDVRGQERELVGSAR